MFTAKKLRDKSIVNYILYMWMIEDTIRSVNLDLENIKSLILHSYSIDDSQTKEVVDWYDNLIAMIHNEHIEERGHLSVLKGLVEDVNDIHLRLLRTPDEVQYNSAFFKILPLLAEFRNKNNAGAEVSDIELMLIAVYGVAHIKLEKKDVSKETLEAVSKFTEILNVLSVKYAAYEADELKLMD